MAVMKVRTEIIDSIAASTIGQALKLVIMYVESFKTSANAFIGKVIISLKGRWSCICNEGDGFVFVMKEMVLYLQWRRWSCICIEGDGLVFAMEEIVLYL